MTDVIYNGDWSGSRKRCWISTRTQPNPLKSNAAADFPVSLYVDQKDDLIFLMTKISYLYMYDIHIGKTLHKAKITTNTVFVTCVQESTGTMFGIPVTSGKVFRILMNGQVLVPYNPILICLVLKTCKTAFERLVVGKEVSTAAKIVASSGPVLRTPVMIAHFQ